jgi:Zn-dependent peptidase ImmA (M78 family)
MSGPVEPKILARSLVADRVKRMLAIVDGRDPQLRDRLRVDAIGEMRGWTSISIKQLSDQPTTECSIAGVYLADATPPEIGIFATLSRRRANFTALHEFGHHLQTFPELVDQLSAQPDYGLALEELSSDAFAARVLLPEDVVRHHLGVGTSTARQVVELWAAGTASRAAVCVVAAQQLQSPGHVILLDEYGAIDFSSSHIEFPLRRGSIQTDVKVMEAWAGTSRTTAEAKSRFAYRNGTRGPELYAQAADMTNGYTVIVAVADRAPWLNLSLSSTERTVIAKWHTCERCEHTFEVWSRCDICHQPVCPECNWCDCKVQKEKTCSDCGLLKSAELFAPGSDLCRDCAQ